MIQKEAMVSSIKGTNEQSLVNGIISEETLLLCELKKKPEDPQKKKAKRSGGCGCGCGSTLSLTDLPSSHF